MKFHKSLFFLFFYLWGAGCGEHRLYHSDPASSHSPLIKSSEGQKSANQTFYTEGEGIHLIEKGFVSANVAARIELVAETGRDREIIYHPRKKKVSGRDVELTEQILRFRRGGEYLVEFIRADQTKEIQTIRVIPNQDTWKNPFKDIHLYAFRDAFYKTIFHLELRFIPDENAGANAQNRDLGSLLNVSWEIHGGRYHILDDELPYFSKIRAFQKSVILKEFGSYEAKVYLNLPDGRVLEKSVTIDFRPEATDTPLLSAGAQLPSFPVNEPVRIFVQNDFPPARYQYAWSVKAVHHQECRQEWLELENIDNLSVRGVLHYICDNGYEEELIAERDYSLSRQDAREAEFLFKNPGKYEVRLLLFDSIGQIHLSDSKRITLYSHNTLASD